MKLYGWRPIGHGQLSFYVAAESKDQAMAAVMYKINLLKSLLDDDKNKIFDYECKGFGTDYYKLSVAEAGVVLVNEND